MFVASDLLEFSTENVLLGSNSSNLLSGTAYGFDTGVFKVGETGFVSFDYLFDGGGYEGELAIFNLEGMDQYEIGSNLFIQEAAFRASQNSPDQGYVVISRTEGARFFGNTAYEGDLNTGNYQDTKTFFMLPGSLFGIMLVSNGTVEDALSYSDINDDGRPLFSIPTANLNEEVQFAQVVLDADSPQVNSNTFSFEDLQINRSDRDYNDLVFQLQGATVAAPSLEEVINPARDWRNSQPGQEIIQSAVDPLDVAGNTINTARRVTVSSAGETYLGWVGSIDTYDYYSFNLDTSNNFNLLLDGLSADADVQLLDANGNIIQISTNPGTTAESINKNLGAGTYNIRVTPFGNVGTPYNLGLSVTPLIDGIATTIGTGGNPTAPIPPGGVALLGNDPLSAFTLSGSLAAQAVVTQVPVEGQNFTSALRAQTNVRTTSDTAIVLRANTLESFRGGDTLFLRLYLRTINTQDSSGIGRIRVNMDSAIWTQTITAGTEWTPWVLAVPARTGYAAGASRLSIGVPNNTAPQTIEIGGLEVLNYGTRVQPDELPYPNRTYEGRNADAAWREAAAESIDTYRKGDLAVVVTDTNGTPIPYANVHVAMKRHAYSFGTAINENTIQANPTSADGILYRDNTLQLFNEAVIENGLKWSGWDSPTTRSRSIQAVEWLRDNDIEVRGHTLVWPSWNNSPASLKTLYDNTLAQQGKAAADEVLRDRIISHIYEEAGYFKGQITDWDVVNETFANNNFQTILGKSVLVDWFNAAHEADPNAILYINENSVENGTKADFYAGEIQYLLDNGAPLGGIGLQGHIGAISVPRFLTILDRFAQFNLPIKITEFDILTPDEQLQADMTRDFMTAVFSHPATDGFLMWGFWDGRHWLYDAPIYYQDWSLKPSGKVYTDLVFNEWWTDVEGQADANGQYTVRGFLGDYEVSASRDFVSQTTSTTVLRDGTTLTIVLP